MKNLTKYFQDVDYAGWLKALCIIGLMWLFVDAIAMADPSLVGKKAHDGGAGAAGTPPSNFTALTGNVKSLERQILNIVQIVVTLCGILLVFRGVVHLKQHSSGSPQEKHLSKGISSIIFAVILFIVVPLLHMFVGTLGANTSTGDQNSWGTGGYDGAGSISK